MKFDIRNNAECVELFIYGDIVSDSSQLWSAEDVCPSIIVDEIKDLGNKPLNIRISSFGGNVLSGIAIYNVLKSYKGFKTTYIDSCACSIASVIAMVSDKIVMYKNSYLMIHQAWLSNATGNATELRKQADLLEEMDNTILNIYKTKLREDYDVQDLQNLISAETWLRADECIKIFNDIEIVEEEVVAFAKATESEFVNNYKNIPTELLNELEEEEKEEDVCEECGKNPCECEQEEQEQVEVEEEQVEVQEEKEEEVEEEEEIKDEEKEEEIEEQDEEVQEEDKDNELCEKCGKNPCECENEEEEEQRKIVQIAQAKKQLSFLEARAFLKKYL